MFSNSRLFPSRECFKLPSPAKIFLQMQSFPRKQYSFPLQSNSNCIQVDIKFSFTRNLLTSKAFPKPSHLNSHSATCITKMHAMKKEQKRNNMNAQDGQTSCDIRQRDPIQNDWTLFTNGTKSPVMVSQQMSRFYSKHFENLATQIQTGTKMKHFRNSLNPITARKTVN